MFALFYTREGQTLQRFSIHTMVLDKNQETNTNIYCIQSVATISPILLKENTNRIVHTILDIRKGNTIITTCYWSTEWSLSFLDTVIPIYEFLHRDILFDESSRRVAIADTAGWCQYRIDQQIRLNQKMISYIRDNLSAFPPGILDRPVLKPRVKELPKFVAEALVKACIDEDCSISMKPFKECESVGVTNCFHCFESDSITTWCKTKNSCPICKTMIESIVLV
jgi:hypothetical protein